MRTLVQNSTSIVRLIQTFKDNRLLVAEMVRREVIGRYQGSIMGMAWSFLNPILLLLVYTFVFAVIFKARWGTDSSTSNSDYAITLFIGLIVHGLLSDVLNRSPALIISNSNYVKKVVFPLELLSVIILSSSIVHAFISLFVLLAALLVHGHPIHWTAIFFPIVLLPFAILVLGLSWILSALGTFLRDMGQAIPMVTMMLMFLAPVVYPISAVPERIQPYIQANPLTFIIEQCRLVVLSGELPNWSGLAMYFVVSAFVAWLGFVIFQKSRSGFADVL